MMAPKPNALAILAAAVCLAAPATAAGMLPGASGKEPYKVDAAKLDYFDKEQKLVYTGDVIAAQGATRVRATAMTIYLDKAAGEGSQASVRRIELKGPVTVAQKDRVGTGDSGVYDRNDNKWYLIGNVTLTEGSDVTRGDRLIYDLGTARAMVEGGRQGRVQSVFTPRDSAKPAPKN